MQPWPPSNQARGGMKIGERDTSLFIVFSIRLIVASNNAVELIGLMEGIKLCSEQNIQH